MVIALVVTCHECLTKQTCRSHSSLGHIHSAKLYRGVRATSSLRDGLVWRDCNNIFFTLEKLLKEEHLLSGRDRLYGAQ